MRALLNVIFKARGIAMTYMRIFGLEFEIWFAREQHGRVFQEAERLRREIESLSKAAATLRLTKTREDRIRAQLIEQEDLQEKRDLLLATDGALSDLIRRIGEHRTDLALENSRLTALKRYHGENTPHGSV